MSLLTMIQQVARVIGEPAPETVIGNTDTTVIQLLALANEEGQDLATRGDWQELKKEQTFSALAQETQTGILPSDFSHMVPDTFWNRTAAERIVGPISDVDWQAYKGDSFEPADPVFRIRGDSVLLMPSPTASDTLAFEYVSDQWCQSSGGTGQSAWAADTDTGKLSENIMALGVEWRFLKQKGIDYGERFMTYEKRVADALAKDLPRGVVALSSFRSRQSEFLVRITP